MSHELLEHNPAFKKPVVTLLALMRDNPFLSREELEKAAEERWEGSFVRTPSVTFDVLVRNDIVTEQVFIDDVPYDGTLEDAMMDFDLPEDATVKSAITMTQDAATILNDYSGQNALKALFEERPFYEDIYQTILDVCSHTGGASRMEVEAAIQDSPELQPDPVTKQTHVYPQYFIDALESEGGIFWDGSWHTTDAGLEMLF